MPKKPITHKRKSVGKRVVKKRTVVKKRAVKKRTVVKKRMSVGTTPKIYISTKPYIPIDDSKPSSGVLSWFK